MCQHSSLKACIFSNGGVPVSHTNTGRLSDSGCSHPSLCAHPCVHRANLETFEPRQDRGVVVVRQSKPPLNKQLLANNSPPPSAITTTATTAQTAMALQDCKAVCRALFFLESESSTCSCSLCVTPTAVYLSDSQRLSVPLFFRKHLLTPAANGLRQIVTHKCRSTCNMVKVNG